MKLPKFLQRSFAPAVEVVREILEMDALLRFLGRFGSHNRNRDLADAYFPEKLFGRQMAEITFADVLDGNDRLAAVLGEQQKSGREL